MLVLVAALPCAAGAQVYKLEPGSSAKPQANQPVTATPQSPSQGLGFGSNIENARLANAAVEALKRGDSALAFTYAERAARAAPGNSQLWFLAGYAARLNRQFQSAVNAYTRGLHIDPSSATGLSGLAQTYAAMGRTADAKRLLQQLVTSNPGRRDDLQLLGDLSMQSGDYTEAIQWLQRAERVRPDARSELLLALSYQHENRMDLARRYLDMARSRAPNNPDVQRSLANYYRQVGNYPEAISALKTIRNPTPDVLGELAYTYQLNGQQKQSAQLYAQAANAEPKNLPMQLSAAQAAVAADRLDDAKPFLDRAAKMDSNSYRLHAIRGEIAQQENRNQDAVREYRAALANLPAQPAEGPLYRPQLHVQLMGLYQELGHDDLARRQLESAQSEIRAVNVQGSGRASFLHLRAVIKMNAGDFDGAYADAQQALALRPQDLDDLQLEGNLLLKLGRPQEAIAALKKALGIDPRSRSALTSLGYASRAVGDNRQAEKYFLQLAHDDPTFYVPYLALGDLYTDRADYKKAESAYARGYAIAPENALIVAGGMNAGIEAHKLDLAGVWLGRVTDAMQTEPRIQKEQERYFNLVGKYKESEEMGLKAIQSLPHDRDVVVYLGYDLLNLNKYQQLRDLTSKYMDAFPKDGDIPLLAGYVYKQDGEQEKAVSAFTEALKRDPTIVTAYVSRGYVRNDLRQPELAADDFVHALKLDPGNGKAHLGLAFAYLASGRSSEAVEQSLLAEKMLGDSKPVHVIRATAYGREGLRKQAAEEYRAALKFTPDDGSLYLGLGNILFAERRWHEAIEQYHTAEKFIPTDPQVYARMALAYASLEDREEAFKNIQLAEQYAAKMPPSSNGVISQAGEVYLAIGEALDTLGDRNGAMQQFTRALLASGSNRVGVRLAISRLMADQGNTAGAERQIALAQMEAEAGVTAAPTGSQYIEAANIFQQMHEYRLSLSYLDRAEVAGAPALAVHVAKANSYLAEGDTARAAAELASVPQSDRNTSNYAYLLAQATLFEQQHEGAAALSAFAQAASAGGADQAAERGLLQAGANEGLRVNSRLSVLSSLIVHPIFEDTPVYVLDSKLLGTTPVPPADISQLPPPRSSIETLWTNAYHLHLGKLPTIGGFFQLRNAQGSISVPATNSIVDRNTFDYTMNVGISPTVHVGRNALTFDSGVQGTIRRDRLSPQQMNQNLFRVFTYMSTSAFFNMVSVQAYGLYETGPFTEINLHSKTTAGAVDFRVGAPWGKTFLLTGWGASDQQFSPSGVENYYTSTYIGLEHEFSKRFRVEAMAEFLRDWRIVESRSAIAQALRPAIKIDYSPARHWNIEATSAYESTRGFHVYDMTRNGIAVSYTRPISRVFDDQTGTFHMKYPIRLSAGVQEQTFPNFTVGKNQKFVPYVSITLF